MKKNRFNQKEVMFVNGAARLSTDLMANIESVIKGDITHLSIFRLKNVLACPMIYIILLK